MSATYTLHVAPYASPGDPEALDRADLVRDGFSWAAFLVPSLWFLRHRHWWLALATLAAEIGLWWGLRLAGFGAAAIWAAEIVFRLGLGFEGTTLRRWSYARRGRPAADVVFAASEAEAEAKTFARWLSPPPIPVPSRPMPLARPVFAARSTHDTVIGLFPDSERRP